MVVEYITVLLVGVAELHKVVKQPLFFQKLIMYSYLDKPWEPKKFTDVRIRSQTKNEYFKYTCIGDIEPLMIDIEGYFIAYGEEGEWVSKEDFENVFTKYKSIK